MVHCCLCPLNVRRLFAPHVHVNDARPTQLAARVAVENDLKSGTVVACLGLSYKADIDDLRESPSVVATKALAELSEGRVIVVEPHTTELPAILSKLENVELCDLDTAMAQADIVMLLTDHRIFKELDTSRLAGKCVYDTRGIWR